MRSQITLLVVGLCIPNCLAFNYNKLIPPTILGTEEEAVAEWKTMEKATKQGVEAIMKQFIPVLLKSASDVEIGPECMGDLLRIVTNLRQLKLWAVKILDSMGKPAGGQLKGTASAFGNYDQCMDIVFPSSSSQGQYCQLEFSIPLPPRPRITYVLESPFQIKNFTFETELFQYLETFAGVLYLGGFRLGVCVPSTCTRTDLQNMVQAAAKNIKLIGNVFSCETKQPLNLDATQITIISLIVSIILIVIACTILDFFLSPVGVNKSETMGKQLIRAFSFPRNLTKTFEINTRSSHKLDALDGLRFISICWVIYGHTYGTADPYMHRNVLNINDIAADILSEFAGNAFTSVLTFFFIAGFLLAHNLVKAFDAHGRAVFNVPLILVRRTWRLLPPILLVIGLAILLPVMGSGPMYQDTASFNSDNCRKNWWYNVLFINNFLSYREMCWLHTWYVAADMQLFIVGMLYFFILFKQSKAANFFLGFLVVGSFVCSAVVIYVLRLPPTFLFTALDWDHVMFYTEVFYARAYPHLGLYALALGLGTFVARTEKIKLSKVTVISGWMCSTALLITLVYVIHPFNVGRHAEPWESILYGSFQRPAWGLAIGWVILACRYDYAGFLGRFLSWGGFQPLVKISYLMYLLHFPLLIFFYSSQEGHLDVNKKLFVWVFMATLSLTMLASVLVRVFLEAPIAQIDKIFITRLIESKTPKPSDVNNQSNNGK